MSMGSGGVGVGVPGKIFEAPILDSMSEDGLKGSFIGDLLTA